MPRLVRRRPLAERLKAWLNPMDFLLWLSEEIETRDWRNSKVVGTQMGLVMNFVFLLARANSGGSRVSDPVFDDGTVSGWFTFFVGLLVWSLTTFSAVNATYTMYRSRHYRLFEADVEKQPQTPSAHRVRVQSSPVSSSPLRLLTDMMSSESAESRAHPDRSRDVWEISVWDPLPICLRLFCLFSPGHVLVYMMFLPLAPLDVRPSVTVFNCIVLQLILSAQLLLFQDRFTQQNKDTAIIQKEVLHEYDTKFVHPNLYPTVRDAATQLSQSEDGEDVDETVEIGTPTVQLRRGFQTRPNPNYIKHIDPDNVMRSNTSNTGTNPGLFTPTASTRHADAYGSDLRNRSSLAARQQARRSTPGLPTSFNPNSSQIRASVAPTSTPFSTSTSTVNRGGDGGYMGVFTHPQSPLKKAPSLGELQYRSPRNNSEMAQLEQYRSARDRSSSPTKSARKSTGTLPPQPPNAWGRPQATSYERYPSMWR
ncbi:3-isopropylmalate dehydratase [Hypoxylon texense]